MSGTIKKPFRIAKKRSKQLHSDIVEFSGNVFHCPKTCNYPLSDERSDYTAVTAATDLHRTSLSFRQKYYSI